MASLIKVDLTNMVFHLRLAHNNSLIRGAFKFSQLGTQHKGNQHDKEKYSLNDYTLHKNDLGATTVSITALGVIIKHCLTILSITTVHNTVEKTHTEG